MYSITTSTRRMITFRFSCAHISPSEDEDEISASIGTRRSTMIALCLILRLRYLYAYVLEFRFASGSLMLTLMRVLMLMRAYALVKTSFCNANRKINLPLCHACNKLKPNVGGLISALKSNELF